MTQSRNSSVEIVGKGSQRRGRIAAGNVHRPPEPDVALPSVDGLSSVPVEEEESDV